MGLRHDPSNEVSWKAGPIHLLLKAVFVLCRGVADAFGCVGVLVDAKADAVGFYRKYGFFELTTTKGELGDRPQPRPMFLELGAIPSSDGRPPGD